jgi:DNA replication protein DnaC
MGAECATPYARIVSNLQELGLDSMAANAGEYMSMVADGRKSFPEALPWTTSAEVALRSERTAGRQIGKASFPCVKTLEDFEWSFQPSVPRAEVEDLATLGFVDRHENVLLVGSPGVGKAHIAVALGVEAAGRRNPACFVGCQRLVEDPGRAAEKGALERRMRFYAHFSLPAVDEAVCLDVGKEGADLLLRLVPGRYERRPTTAATNVGVGMWADVFGDAAAASAIADRLCHHCHPVRITGRSCRPKDLPAGSLRKSADSG